MDRISKDNSFKVIPYFQPIISVRDSSIFGYEVLGRYDADNSLLSISNILSDKDLSTPQKLEYDRQVRQQAMQQYKQAGCTHKLFININPSWMDYFPDPGQALPTLEYIEEYAIPAQNIVIEITEHDIAVDFDRLQAYLERYRSAGCQIAVDDFSFDHFDRLLIIMPDMVKIDIKLLRQGGPNQEYTRLINYIARFSVEMGMEVIFEGIESEQELQNALTNGGGYLQGYLFSPPSRDFQPDSQAGYIRMVSDNLHSCLEKDLQKKNQLLETEMELNLFIRRLVDTKNFMEAGSSDRSLQFLEKYMPAGCIRAYICDRKGFQVSANFTRMPEGKFVLEPEFQGKNWAWRPYFTGNLARMDYTRSGCLSDAYIDYGLKREIHTYSLPLGEGRYLFLDLEGLT